MPSGHIIIQIHDDSAQQVMNDFSLVNQFFVLIDFTKPEENPLQRASRSSGEAIQYLQTQKLVFSPSVNQRAALRGEQRPRMLCEAKKRWQGPPHINTVKRL